MNRRVILVLDADADTAHAVASVAAGVNCDVRFVRTSKGFQDRHRNRRVSEVAYMSASNAYPFQSHISQGRRPIADRLPAFDR